MHVIARAHNRKAERCHEILLIQMQRLHATILLSDPWATEGQWRGWAACATR